MLFDVRDHIDELTEALPRQELPATLESLGRDLPAGAEGRAEYLASAGEWFAMNDRYDDARRCFEEARVDGGETVLDVEAQLVALFLQSGDQAAADALAARLRRRSRDLDYIDFEFLAESFEGAGRLEDAHRWFTLALREEDPGELDLEHPAYFCAAGRRRVRQRLGLPADRFDQAAERERPELADRADTAPAPTSEAVFSGLLYWPEDELSRLAQRWPEVAAGYGAAAEHRAATQEHARQYDDEGLQVGIAAGTVEEFAAFCDERDLDPEQSGSRASYAAELARQGRARRWPPQRNEPCWCGSGLKYKRCCGRPGT